MEHLKRKFSSRKPLLLITVVFLIIISATSIVLATKTVMKAVLFPGPLSDQRMKEEPIEGYMSHAEFEQDCGHCHGPIHCVQDTRCQDCHFEVAQQRAEMSGLHGRLPGISQCRNCHPEHLGKDALITTFTYSNVDHKLLANFSLDLHMFDYDDKPMGCESCHAQGGFLPVEVDCITCHSSDDHDQMASHIEMFGVDCVACHDGVDRYSEFEHADYYVLDGEHENLACEDCHLEKQYAETPQDCASCHQGKMFVDIFGQACNRCHSTTAWLPAELTRHTFLVNHGVDYTPTCDTCHTHTYKEYTCSGCHDLNEMTASHSNLGVDVIDECNECHITGSENEILQLKSEYSFYTSPELEHNEQQSSTQHTTKSIPDAQSIDHDSLKAGYKNDTLCKTNDQENADGREGSS